MIEVLKQALEALKDVGILTDREWQAVHKNKANELRQAIANLESQEPVCEWCDGTGMVDSGGTQPWGEAINIPCRCQHTHPPQRKPLTDGDFLDWYDSAIWGNEDFEQCCQIAFEAGWQFAHGIKE